MSSEGKLSPGDPSSYSRPDIAKVVDIHVEWQVDFDKKILDGSVILTVERVIPEAKQVLLDTRDLVISSVSEADSNAKLGFVLDEPGYAGSKLCVDLPPGQDKLVKVKICYRTTESCCALQWLDPMLTEGKTHPYLLSQCQAINCRSMIPLQDTPSVKCPYRAKVSVPSELTVLMSAIKQGNTVPDALRPQNTVTEFFQKVPIQSYLIAIAVGRLESRKIGPRSHVWSEKEVIEKAAYEFGDIERILQTSEDLCGPYVWGIYDLLVLPPSFPYGGMENPCVTFITPTLLAGDRSLTNVVAHEIAHSWTGNLVTNKTFEHFWLNEGFTVFSERKIVGRMHGEAIRHLEAFEGWKCLQETIDHLGHDNPDTCLVVNLDGHDPDDKFSSVPYEKGSAFLWYLEQTVGGADQFEPFLRKYYDTFQYQSIDSDTFKQFFLDHFKEKAGIKDIEWDKWFYSPGMPVRKPDYDESKIKVCKDLCQRLVEWKEVEEANKCPINEQHFVQDFSSTQMVVFLQLLLEEQPLSLKKMTTLQSLYPFDKSGNAEIRFRWIRLGLKARWEAAIAPALQIVTEVGRMKFIKPLYRDLYGWQKSRDQALATFDRNQVNMMHVAIQAVKKDLHLA